MVGAVTWAAADCLVVDDRKTRAAAPLAGGSGIGGNLFFDDGSRSKIGGRLFFDGVGRDGNGGSLFFDLGRRLTYLD